MPTNFVIIANGPFLIREIITAIVSDKTVIALDGAANKLHGLSITPHFILGDFDSIAANNPWGIKQTIQSIQDDSESYLGARDVLIIPNKNQDLTDLEKAIDYCDQLSAQQIEIICAIGGRLDLHESNMRSLISRYKKGRPIYLHGETQTVRCVKDETVTIKGNAGDKCGVFSCPQAIITTRGLLYECQDQLLKIGYFESVANSLIKQDAKLEVQGTALVVMPAMYQAQQNFAKLSEVDRLKLQLRDAEIAPT